MQFPENLVTKIIKKYIIILVKFAQLCRNISQYQETFCEIRIFKKQLVPDRVIPRYFFFCFFPNSVSLRGKCYRMKGRKAIRNAKPKQTFEKDAKNYKLLGQGIVHAYIFFREINFTKF